MSFNFDQNRHVANRVGQEVEIKEQARKEKNRMELPDEKKGTRKTFPIEPSVESVFTGTSREFLEFFLFFMWCTGLP